MWTRVVVAILILFGDGALASGNDQNINDKYTANGYAAQLLPPDFSGDDLLLINPPPSGLTAVIRIISTASQPVIGATSPALISPEYRLFSARAPPIPV